MNRWVLAAVVAVAGIGAGYLVAAPARGRDKALSEITVSADGRTIAARGERGDVLTAEETATTVRLRLHVADHGLPSAGEEYAITVGLDSPLADRQLIDATRPDARAAVRRPTVLPAGFAPVTTYVDFAHDRCVQTYASPGGGLVTVIDEPAAPGDAPPGAWRATRGGRTVTVTATGYGFDLVGPGEAARVGASIA